MYYIIQENVFREHNYEILRETLDRFKLSYTVVRVFPFVEKIVKLEDIPDGSFDVDDLPEFSLDRKDVFVFGAIKLARIAAERGWIPGSMMNENHDFLVYREFYRENLLNWDSKIMKFSDEMTWEINESKFMRPTKDTKTFNGKVYRESEWKDFVEYSLWNGHTTTLNADTEIQVSTPKLIQKEIRFWVVGGKVISGSQYRLGNSVIYEECIDQDAYDFAQSMVDKFQLNDAFVIDTCLVDNQWKIVECGCINCAGFYRGDMQKIIMAIDEYFNEKINKK